MSRCCRRTSTEIAVGSSEHAALARATTKPPRAQQILRHTAGAVLALLTALCSPSPAYAQVADAATSGPPADVQKMIRDGMGDGLEARFKGGRTADEKQWIAQAYVNQSRKARTPDERRRVTDKADAKYREWLAQLEQQAQGGALKARVRLAVGRVAYAGMILSDAAGPGLDEFELTLGQRGGDRLRELLETADAQYEKADAELKPILERRIELEEELLASGLLDAVLRARLDRVLSSGWTHYYLAQLSPADAPERRTHLQTAEQRFQSLVNEAPTGPMRYQCYLALALAQREQGRYRDAADNLRLATGPDADVRVNAQVQYETARLLLDQGQFDAARQALRPLTAKSPRDLAPEDVAIRFYINLAHVWDAYSYLLEAEGIRKSATDVASRLAILQQAQRVREVGLTRMKRLADLGGPWPGLVQLYVSRTVDLAAPPDRLSPMELLFTATSLLEAKRPHDALLRLEEAARRPNVDPQIAADVLFELGRCLYQLRRERPAAEAFAKLATDYRNSAKAMQAATFALELWGRVAEQSKRAEDYLALAHVLKNIVENYADHPKRDDALWLWPVTLELAGHYDEAIERFGKVTGARHRDEAAFRQALCRRRAVEAQRKTLSAAEFKERSVAAAKALQAYADESLERADQAAKPADMRKWSAQARVAAAELLVAPEVADFAGALETLAKFEQQYPDSDLLGRVLGSRIRAYRGQRDFAAAARTLEQFLSTATAAQAGPTLAALAQGMQEEVERLLADGQADAARTLAGEAVATFDELEKWVRADPQRAANVEFVQTGRARMLYLAGQYDTAKALAEELLKAHPKNGNYQYLLALVLSGRLTEASPQADVQAAKDAWGVLVSDAGIRQRAPERYWEAFYQWHALALRLGQAEEVEKNLTQYRVLYPELGGAPWKEKLEALLVEARTKLGLPTDLAPVGPSPTTETAPSDSQPTTP